MPLDQKEHFLESYIKGIKTLEVIIESCRKTPADYFKMRGLLNPLIKLKPYVNQITVLRNITSHLQQKELITNFMKVS